MSSIFTLQVNDSGAWRNVVKGSAEQLQEIENHVQVIAQIMGAKYKWRIIDAAFGTVIGYCNAPGFTWTPLTVPGLVGRRK